MSDELTKSQKEAIEFSGKDVLISAGAGSGKTFTLVKRIQESIIKGNDISRKLIVTFTNAAASELKAKIRSALSDILKKDPKNKHITEQFVKIENADICTIDSFCMKLVKSNIDKLAIEENIRIAEEEEAKNLKSEAMNEVIDDYYESSYLDQNFAIAYDCYSSVKDENAFGDNLIALYNKLISTSESLELLNQDVDSNCDFMETKYGTILINYLESFCNHYEYLFGNSLKTIKENELLSKSYNDVFSYDYDYVRDLRSAINTKNYEKIKELLNNFGPPRKKTYKGELIDYTEYLNYIYTTFSEDLKNKIKDIYFIYNSRNIKSSIEYNNKICSALYFVLCKFDETYKRKKMAVPVFDFNDIERLARNLLCDENGNPTQFAKEVSARYDEIYIDEYQDTSSIQDDIFRSISNSNRFMVGDIKQSIYKFRSAEPEIFTSYRTKYEDETNGKNIFMSNNFRCDEPIIDFTNMVSDYMFSKSMAIPYESGDKLIFTKRDPAYNYPVEVHVFTPDKAKKEKDETTQETETSITESEASFVAKRIKQLLKEDPTLKPSDIAILIRSFKNEYQAYANELEKENIGFECINTDDVLETPEVMLILCILNCIDNPLRDVYLAGAMCSKIFNFTLDDMALIKSRTKDSSSLYDSLNKYLFGDDLEAKIKDFLEKLNYYRQKARRLNIYETLSFIYTDTGIIAMSDEGEKNSLYHFYNIAKEYEDRYAGNLYSFLRYIEKSKIDSSQKAQASDTVKILSIHKSKGLEYEVVFLVSCGKEFNKRDLSDSILFERKVGVAGYMGQVGGVLQFNTLPRECVKLNLNNSQTEEEMRVLYVAMTRARRRLIITGKTSKLETRLNSKRMLSGEFSKYSTLSTSTFLEWIMGSIYAYGEKPFYSLTYHTIGASASVSESQSNETEIADDVNDKTNDIISTLKDRFAFEYPYKYYSKLPSKLSISKIYPNILDEESDYKTIQEIETINKIVDNSENEPSAADRGTATHLFLQFCDFNSLMQNGVVFEIDRLVNDSFISKETSELINQSYIENFVKSDLFKEILNSKQIWREFRFNIYLDASKFSSDEALKNEKVLVQGATDCLFENKDGKYVLVDYKTDNVTDDNYKYLLLKRHKNQLLYYKEACEIIFEHTIDQTLIYSVPLAKTVSV